MPAKMHVRWNDLEKPSSSPKSKKSGNSVDGSTKPETTNSKTINIDLYQALFPIYYLSKICGLLPIKLTQQPSGRYQGQLRVPNIIYSILLYAAIMGAQFYGLWRDLKDGWENSTRLKSQTSVIATSSDVLGMLSLTSVCILGSPFRWKYLQTIMNKLVEADEKLGVPSLKKTRRFSIILTACSFVYLLITSICDIYTWGIETKNNKKMKDKGPLNYSPLYFMYIVIFVMEIQYAIAAYNVGQRFARLNKALDNIQRTGKITDQFRKDLGLAGDLRDQGQFASYIRQDLAGGRIYKRSMVLDWYTSADHRNFAESVSELITVHATLCDTVQVINNAFGIVIIVITVTCLLHLIITPYFLIMEADGNRMWVFLVVQSLWCFLHLCRLLLVVQPTYNTVTQSKETAVIVSQLLSASPDTEIRKQLEIFSLQLLHRPVEFSACGLFSLDRSLVTSIAGAVTTYLVILIQFQKADDTKGDVDNILKNATQILRNASSLHNFTALKIN